VRVRQPSDHVDVFLTRPAGASGAERLVRFGNVMAARTISTYAFDKASGVRIGDPICDHYAARLASNRQIYAVADGCGWGGAAARAAQAACRTFVNQLHARRSAVVDMKSACLEVLLAMAEANVNVKRVTVGERAGTTTLVGGLLLRLDHAVTSGLGKAPRAQSAAGLSSSGDDVGGGAAPGKCTHVFVMASLGDVKVFHYVSALQQCADVTQHVLVDYAKFKSEDPGGRLGAQIDGDADLRNLAVSIVPCMAGDAFAMLSDGVHDNLDPEKLGIVPPANVGGGQWSALPLEAVDFIKRRFQRHFLEGVFRSACGLSRSHAFPPVDLSGRADVPRIGGHRSDASTGDDGGGGDEKRGRAALTGSRRRGASSSSSDSAPSSGSSLPPISGTPATTTTTTTSTTTAAAASATATATATTASVNVSAVTEELLAFSRFVTKASRKFMLNNPRLQLPNDFAAMPGKQDHGTCLVFSVGDATTLQ
jgi:hypothetical protein